MYGVPLTVEVVNTIVRLKVLSVAFRKKPIAVYRSFGKGPKAIWIQLFHCPEISLQKRVLWKQLPTCPGLAVEARNFSTTADGKMLKEVSKTLKMSLQDIQQALSTIRYRSPNNNNNLHWGCSVQEGNLCSLHEGQFARQTWFVPVSQLSWCMGTLTWGREWYTIASPPKQRLFNAVRWMVLSNVKLHTSESCVQ